MTSHDEGGREGEAGGDGPHDGGGGISLVEQLVHDARSPVSALVVLAEDLRQETEGDAADPVLQRKLRLIHAAALGLDSLLQQISALSELDGPLRLPEPTPFSLAGVVHGAARALEPVASLQGVELHCRVDDSERRLGPGAAVMRSLTALGSLPLQRYGAEGELALGAESDPTFPAQVLFSVETDVPGPDPDTVREVKGVALNGRPRTRACYANGALELAFRMVDLMGSSLSVESGGELGTRFSFRLSLPPVPES